MAKKETTKSKLDLIGVTTAHRTTAPKKKSKPKKGRNKSESSKTKKGSCKVCG